MASKFLMWASLIEPVLNKALAIIPHLKEIISIAFKPFNGKDILDNHDETHLRNRIDLIDSKLSVLGMGDTTTAFLDSTQRSIIIRRYNLKMVELEKLIISEFIKPYLNNLLFTKLERTMTIENKFISFFDKEMEHSFMLPEKVFSLPPVKEGILRNLQKGLDFLLELYPSRVNCDDFIGTFELKISDKSRKDNWSWRFAENNRPLIEVIGLTNYIWNNIGVKKDRFLYIFDHLGIPSIYYVCCPKGCMKMFYAVYERQDKLEVLFDKLIICLSLTLRLLKNTSTLDEDLIGYLYPKRPLEGVIQESKEREKNNYGRIRIVLMRSGSVF
jgi:hypothetical protein